MEPGATARGWLRWAGAPKAVPTASVGPITVPPSQILSLDEDTAVRRPSCADLFRTGRLRRYSFILMYLW